MKQQVYVYSRIFFQNLVIYVINVKRGMFRGKCLGENVGGVMSGEKCLGENVLGGGGGGRRMSGAPRKSILIY